MTLVDLPGDWASDSANPSAPVFAEMGYPVVRRLDTGVYEGLRGSHLIEHLIVEEFPFSPTFGKRLTPEERIEAVVAQYRDDTPRDYGVCDHYSQVLDRWPSLLTDERNFLLSLTEIRKADQPARSGWRWHKNGEYIGTGNPQREYLADEDGFDSVWMFQIFEVTAPAAPLFTHDCDGCTFLGHHEQQDGTADLYFCPQGNLPTVIARHSDDGPDYTSGMVFADSDPHLNAARLRAQTLGLVPFPEEAE